MMERSINTDEKSMEKGISQLLGFTPYESKEPTEPCDHLSDGFNYGDKGRRVVRKCDICGVFYEEEKE